MVVFPTPPIPCAAVRDDFTLRVSDVSAALFGPFLERRAAFSYVSRQLYWHFRGALEEGEDPPDAWLAHPDSVIKANVAMALGLDTLMARSDRHESAGELVRAAQA